MKGLIPLKRILFVCTGNTCRSPMAEKLFENLVKERGNKDAKAFSAGIYAFAGDPASSMAISVMKGEFGIDLTSHRSKVLDIDDIRGAWLILAMTEEHKRMILDIYPESADKLYTLKEYAESADGETSISDPFGGDYENYRECAFEIQSALIDIMDKVFDNDE
jgi:protein-tyrosine-phosphatase